MTRPMSIKDRILKLVRDPFGVLRNRWTSFSEWIRFGGSRDYSTVEYWKYRHSKYGFDLRGVGDKTKSHEENIRLLEQGRRVFLDVCNTAGVTFPGARVLDIGCGTGFFAEVVRNNGVRDYLGIDIVDTLFEGLRIRCPGYLFERLDVSVEPLHGSYDLILAMDVLQHIVDENKFIFAVRNMISHLAPSGIVIISTHLGPQRRDGFYVVRRPIEEFQRVFAEFTINKPVAYADSFVFSLRRKH
ncbi:MAG TPA: class I SAM-dependent methyltransferase [Bacteroidota bacterium]